MSQKLIERFERETGLKARGELTDGNHVFGIKVWMDQYVAWLEDQIGVFPIAQRIREILEEDNPFNKTNKDLSELLIVRIESNGFLKVTVENAQKEYNHPYFCEIKTIDERNCIQGFGINELDAIKNTIRGWILYFGYDPTKQMTKETHE